MGKKKNTLIYLDEDVVKEAKELGLNISKTCENCLKQAVKQMRPLYGQSDCNSISDSSQEWRRVWDLNPRGHKGHRLSRPAPYQARVTRLG